MDPKFIIKTSMTKEDYKKFLYLATFKQNKIIIPIILIMTLVASIIISLDGSSFKIVKFIILWIVFLVISFIGLIFKIERRNKQRIRTDNTGSFDSINTLKFYDDKISIENESINSRSELRYDMFHILLESSDYYIFYLTANEASLLRKEDIEDKESFKEFISQKFDNIKKI